MLVEREDVARISRKVAVLCQGTANKLIVSLAAMLLLLVTQSVQATVTVAGTTAGQLSVSPTGAALYSIPLVTPPGIAGIEPKLGITYSSQSGNGILGLGWNISGLSSIMRCPKTLLQDGVISSSQNDLTDKYCLDGQRLIAITGSYGADGTEYRTEQETYSRIISHGVGVGGPVWFQVWDKSGRILEYGNSPVSAIQMQGKTSTQFWTLNKVSDIKGNYLTITNEVDSVNGQFHPLRVDYTGNAKAVTSLTPNKSVVFVYSYGTRPDIIPMYTQGSPIKTTVLLSNIKTYVGSTLIKDYQLRYENVAPTYRSRLISVTECDGTSTTCLAPTKLTWMNGVPNFAGWQAWGPSTSPVNFSLPVCTMLQMADVNGDGLADQVCAYNYGGTYEQTFVKISNGANLSAWQGWGPATAPGSFSLPNCGMLQMVDVNADGLADQVCAYNYGTSERTFVKVGGGTTASAWQAWGPSGSFMLSQCRLLQMVDVNGDGFPDQVCAYDNGNSSEVNYVKINTGTNLSAWQVWGPVSAAGSFILGQCTLLQMVDVNGDGLPDEVCGYFYSGSFDRTFVKINTGASATGWQAWGAASASFDLSACKLSQMADVNGDGLPDQVCDYDNAGASEQSYVRINTGSALTAWQTWGPIASTLTLSNCKLLQMADVNGDGLADQVCVYDNAGASEQTYVKISSGTGFSAWQVWSPLSGSVVLSNCLMLQLGDVNGDGLPDQVCAYNGSVEQTFVEPLSPTFHEQLNSYSNGLGAVTSISYKPLTDGTVYTKGSGSVYPVIDLQMPMYVVSSVSSSNGIGGTFTSNYTYAGAKSHQRGGGFLGFNKVTSTDAQTNISSTSFYGQGFSCAATGQADTQYPYCFYDRGQTLSAEKRTASGMLLNQVTNSWSYVTNPATWGAQYHVPLLAQSNETNYELASDGTAQGALVTQTTTCNVDPVTGKPAYDAYGNQTYNGVWSTNVANCATPPAKAGLFVKETNSTYSNDTINWFLGRLTNVSVTNTVPYAIPPVSPRTALPTMTIAALVADQAEGNVGATPFTFTVSRGGNTAVTSSVNYAVTGSGTAPIAPANVTDFVGGVFPSGTITFAAGQTTQTLTVNVQGNTVSEPDEGFTVTLSDPVNVVLGASTAAGVIRNDDPPPISITPLVADQPEGNTGTTPFTFTVTRSGYQSAVSTVNWAVTGSTAYPVQAADFSGGVLPSGTLTFAIGQTSQIVTINVLGNTLYEPSKGFTVTLSNPTAAILGTSNAAGMIRNDDPWVVTIAANTSDYNLRAAAIATGWDQVSPMNATVTISPNVIISASSTANPAFSMVGAYPAGSSINLVIGAGAYIVGKGGTGGYGNIVNAVAINGSAGGLALSAVGVTGATISITNNGVIGGGGGGGGGGGLNSGVWGGGGGGGAGYGLTSTIGSPYLGAAGGLTTGGVGGTGGTPWNYAGGGGTGGALGVAGGNCYGPQGGAGYGGAAGAAVDGNERITWLVPGTRLGSIYTNVFNQVISANTQNYNLRAAAVAAGWDQVSPLSATVTVNSSVVIGSGSTATPALTIAGSYPAGSSINLAINAGAYVVGAGGTGGSFGSVGGAAGTAGGIALALSGATGASITITNNGVIGGGGGGGGSGGKWLGILRGGGGGGGGAGVINGVRGTGSTYSVWVGQPGVNGTNTTGGAGGAGSGGAGGGGAGGNLGANGNNGGAGSGGAGGAGGAAGVATSGAANATWLVTGTRLGAVQ